MWNGIPEKRRWGVSAAPERKKYQSRHLSRNIFSRQKCVQAVFLAHKLTHFVLEI